MAHEPPPNEWPSALSRCWIESARILTSSSEEEEKPGRDALGNPGRVRIVRHTGRLGVDWPRGRVVSSLEAAGLRATRRTAEEIELTAPTRADVAGGGDPFLLEKSVVAVVHGRELPERQRAAIESKVAELRRELDAVATAADRRTTAVKMIGELEDGLRSTVDVRSVVRRFRPTIVVADAVASIGTVVAVRVGSRIVYDVAAAKPEAGDEEGEPMVFHVLALGAKEVALLYTGGVHGTRHLRDLDGSRLHHAWFANRERVKTDATAPWIGRAVYRQLVETGVSDLVVHKRRDEGPVALEKTGEGVHRLRTGEESIDVPVVLCRSARGDELAVLADAENPLVLRLYETGAELVRTVVAVESQPSRAVAADARSA